MEKLTTKELSAAKYIINQGLTRAAESLSFFMKEQIKFNELDFNVNKLNLETEFTSKRGSNIHLLITNVIGELKGVCCLVFSEEEADKLRQTALPKEIIENPAMMAEMSDAILLEVDNIISASVITEFSNILNTKIYGGVPDLKKFDVTQLNQFVSDNYSKDLYIINFKTHFTSSQLDFNPDFVWLFDNSFQDSIKSFAQNKFEESRLEVSL